MPKHCLIVGLDQPELDMISGRLEGDWRVIGHEMMPIYELRHGELWVDSDRAPGSMRRVDAVVFHGIFPIEQDLDFLTALALWGGACLPEARGMLVCRLRGMGLVEARRWSRFGGMPRGFMRAGQRLVGEGERVAKWGQWHCGEGKAIVGGGWVAPESAIIEPLIEGVAVRVMLMGERVWQVRLEGDGWQKSIHHPSAAFTALDEALVEDTRRLSRGLGLCMIGVDYMIDTEGVPHLLEVNHAPNVTRFAEVREAFGGFVVDWLGSLGGAAQAQTV
jgi:hypothetical protein